MSIKVEILPLLESEAGVELFSVSKAMRVPSGRVVAFAVPLAVEVAEKLVIIDELDPLVLMDVLFCATETEAETSPTATILAGVRRMVTWRCLRCCL